MYMHEHNTNDESVESPVYRGMFIQQHSIAVLTMMAAGMMEEIQKSPIRSLRRIVVCYESSTFEISLDLDLRKNDVDNLTLLEGEFLRKLRAISLNSYFSVLGRGSTSNESPEQIFVQNVVNPYMKNDLYPLIDRDGTGFLSLARASTADVNNRRSHRGSCPDSSKVSTLKSRHKPTYVRFPFA